MSTRVIVSAFKNVLPINSVTAGAKTGHFTDTYDHITDATVRLQQANGVKNLSVVHFGRATESTKEYIRLLRQNGKQLCRYAPNYLLGLLTQFPEEKMPEELLHIDIVAPDLQGSSVFKRRGGDESFLCVGRAGKFRRLNLQRIGREFADDVAFLVEDVRT